MKVVRYFHESYKIKMIFIPESILSLLSLLADEVRTIANNYTNYTRRHKQEPKRRERYFHHPQHVI